jgi:UDP-glucuronate decarboxylase
MNKIICDDLICIVGDNKDKLIRLEGKTILVTGANGLVPYYLTAALIMANDSLLKRNPCNVIALCRNRLKAQKKFDDFLSRDDFTLWIQDVCEPIPTVKEINYIIHGASPASPKSFGKSPVSTLLPNVLGTYHLLEYARQHKIESLLFLSSGEVYGRSPAEAPPFKENDFYYLDPMDVRSCYAEGKRCGETMCASYGYEFGVPVKIGRLAHSYGPGLDFEDGRVFADFVGNIVRRENIILKSNGSAKRSFTYLSDVTTALLDVLLKGTNGESYNIANETAYISILELAELLVKLFPERGLTVQLVKPVSGVYLKSPNLTGSLDTSKIKSLGWNPKVSIQEGFRRTIESFE